MITLQKTKDWTGNGRSVFGPLSASNHSDDERAEFDYYATHPSNVEMLLELENFAQNIWEPAAGGLHISNVLESHGKQVYKTDIVDRGGLDMVMDFLEYKPSMTFDMDIITNPPYSKASEFVEKALECVSDGNKIAMFLKIQFLEGKKRRELFEKYPPKTVWVSSSRLKCGKNGVFDSNGSAVCYCWFIWVKGFTGRPEIRWFN